MHERMIQLHSGVIFAGSSQVLREEQFSKIQELEDEMVNTRNQHAKSIQALKENFLHDKEKFRLEAETKIRTLQQEANKVSIKWTGGDNRAKNYKT